MNELERRGLLPPMMPHSGRCLDCDTPIKPPHRFCRECWLSRLKDERERDEARAAYDRSDRDD